MVADDLTSHAKSSIRHGGVGLCLSMTEAKQPAAVDTIALCQ